MADKKPGDAKIPIKRIPEGPMDPELGYNKGVTAGGDVAVRPRGPDVIYDRSGYAKPAFKKGGRVAIHNYCAGGKVISARKF